MGFSASTFRSFLPFLLEFITFMPVPEQGFLPVSCKTVLFRSFPPFLPESTLISLSADSLPVSWRLDVRLSAHFCSFRAVLSRNKEHSGRHLTGFPAGRAVETGHSAQSSEGNPLKDTSVHVGNLLKDTPCMPDSTYSRVSLPCMPDSTYSRVSLRA